jgi:hypothetical protein
MSDLILENDVTASIYGSEWHGKAEQKKAEEMWAWIQANLGFPIRECDASITIDGETVALKNEDGKGWKILVADCRGLVVNPYRPEHPASFVPVHIPKQDYSTSDNLELAGGMLKALDELQIGYNIVTAGSLGNLRHFYMSVEFTDLANLRDPKGHELKQYLTAIQSHDGSNLRRFKNSGIRTVCKNTYDATIAELSALDITGKKTKNGHLFISNMEEALKVFFTGQEAMAQTFQSMESDKLTLEKMKAIAAGYYLLPAMQQAKQDGKALALDKIKLSKQAQNAIAGVVELAIDGEGNEGKTVYDLWNGFTDYYSNGAGVGSDTVGLSKKVYRSRFGSAAKHKTDVFFYLSNQEAIAEGMEIGGNVLANV